MNPLWLIIIIPASFMFGFLIACILASRSRDDRNADESLFNAVNKKENDDN